MQLLFSTVYVRVNKNGCPLADDAGPPYLRLHRGLIVHPAQFAAFPACHAFNPFIVAKLLKEALKNSSANENLY